MAEARAPYNFIPLPEKVLPAQLDEGQLPRHDTYDTHRHTGYFEVALQTQTPLFIRGMLTQKQKQDGQEAKNIPHPFMLNGQPVIAGSSLRGMLRNLFEIVTFSKMQFVTDQQLIYRAVGDKTGFGEYYRSQMMEELKDEDTNPSNLIFNYPSDNLRAGYLVKNPAPKDKESDWAIRPAQTSQFGHSFALVNSSAAEKIGLEPAFYSVSVPIWVQPEPRTDYSKTITSGKLHLKVPQTDIIRLSDPNDPLYKRARIVVAGKTIGHKGHHWYTAVFDADQDATIIPIPQKMWEIFSADADSKRSDDLKTRPLVENAPLFYLMSGEQLYFFGSTMFFRLPYEKRVQGLIDYQQDSNNPFDFTDAVFGYVSDTDKEGNDKARDPVAYAGRVSVTSATLMEGQSDVLYGESQRLTRTPGTPKPTTFQHYLEQPSGMNTHRANLQHYGSPKAQIRGHKLYWRQRVNIKQLTRGNSDGSKPKIETQFRPIKEGTWFRFRVYFENLTEVELGALAWVLTLDGDERLYHMLGMGKPYGLGVVKVTVEQMLLTDRANRYQYLFDTEGDWYTAAQSADLGHYIQQFKGHVKKQLGIEFDSSERIEALKTMLHLFDPLDNLFNYMTIEPNEYSDRRVLPTPHEVARFYEGKAQEYAQEKETLQRAERKRERELLDIELQSSGIKVGDIIFGKNKKQLDDPEIEFTPEKIRNQDTGKWVALQKNSPPYKAVIPPAHKKRRQNNDAKVNAKVIEIREGQPIILICEQIENLLK
jgi:CRISPR-associated protein (TIGR03986 family)